MAAMAVGAVGTVLNVFWTPYLGIERFLAMLTLLLVTIASLSDCTSYIVGAVWMSYSSKSLLTYRPGVPVLDPINLRRAQLKKLESTIQEAEQERQAQLKAPEHRRDS